MVPAVIDGSERASAAAGPRRVRPESAAGGAAESGAEGAREHKGHLRVRESHPVLSTLAFLWIHSAPKVSPLTLGRKRRTRLGLRTRRLINGDNQPGWLEGRSLFIMSPE